MAHEGARPGPKAVQKGAGGKRATGHLILKLSIRAPGRMGLERAQKPEGANYISRGNGRIRVRASISERH